METSGAARRSLSGATIPHVSRACMGAVCGSRFAMIAQLKERSPMTTRPKITDTCAWLGSEMARSRRWQRDLPAGAVGAIDAALYEVQRRGLAWREVTRESFPLPGLKALFADIQDELENGSGMMKLRG